MTYPCFLKREIGSILPYHCHHCLHHRHYHCCLDHHRHQCCHHYHNDHSSRYCYRHHCYHHYHYYHCHQLNCCSSPLSLNRIYVYIYILKIDYTKCAYIFKKLEKNRNGISVTKFKRRKLVMMPNTTLVIRCNYFKTLLNLVV